MRNRIGRRVAAAIAAVLTLLTVPVTGAIAVAPAESLSTYAYDGQYHPALMTGFVTERGSPAVHLVLTTHYAVASWSPGAFAFSVERPSRAVATYDDPARFVKVARATSTTDRRAEVISGRLVDFELGPVAANNESRVGRLLGNRVRDERGSIGPFGKSYDPDQQALIQLAKEAKRRGGLSQNEANTLADWADEFGLPGHGPMTHPRPGWSGSNVHINIGSIKHILVR